MMRCTGSPPKSSVGLQGPASASDAPPIGREEVATSAYLQACSSFPGHSKLWHALPYYNGAVCITGCEHLRGTACPITCKRWHISSQCAQSNKWRNKRGCKMRLPAFGSH